MLAIELTIVCLAGIIAGAVINFCADRLPYEKSLVWPAQRCPSCLRPFRWFELIPLLGYVLMRGRCRNCGASLSRRYLFVELFTAAAFVSLFVLEIMGNTLKIPLLALQHQAILAGNIEWHIWQVFGYHALLLSLLVLISVCDLEHLEIPMGITVVGTLIGLTGATLYPWPFPGTQALPVLRCGLYPWPVWAPLPNWLPAGSWQLGLCTGLAGALVGTLVLRGVRFLFGLGRGIEGLGLGDADLMMMAGSFVGWQPILLAFFVGVFPALLFGVIQILRKGNEPMPFGPSLAIGVILTLLSWATVGEHFRPILFDGWIMTCLFGLGAVFLLLISFLLRFLRGPSAA